MYKILLGLVAGPTLAGLLLTLPLMAQLASAAEANRTTTQAIAASTPNSVSCSLLKTQSEMQSAFHLSNKTLIASAAVEIPVEYPGTDFSAAESDAAVALFGCDCPSCIGALQQLRSQSLLNGQGHCLSALQERSQQEVQKVLNTLEAEEASQETQSAED